MEDEYGKYSPNSGDNPDRHSNMYRVLTCSQEQASHLDRQPFQDALVIQTNKTLFDTKPELGLYGLPTCPLAAMHTQDTNKCTCIFNYLL